MSIRKLCVTATMVSIAALIPASAYARDDARDIWRASMSAGLNSNGWEWDMALSYWPVDYVGIKCAIGFAGEIEAFEDWDLGYDDGCCRDDKNYTVRFRFMPSLDLISPVIFNWKSQDATFHLFANSGLSLSPGARGSRNAGWFNWFLRGGVEAAFSEFVFRIGYGCTDFNIYSGNPYNENGLPERTDDITHSGFVEIAYKF